MMIKQTKVIFTEELKKSFRSRKIIFVLIILIMAGILLKSLMTFQLLILVFLKAEEMLPLTILVPYYFFVFIIPSICILLAYDIISEEVEKGTIRHIAYRTGRSSIVLGKFLSMLLIIILVIFLTFIASFTYTAIKFDRFIVKETLIFFLFLVFYALYFLSLGTLISVASKKSQRALFVSFIAAMLLFIMKFNENFSWLSPFKYYNSVFSETLNAFLLFFVFSAVFIVLSLIIFKRQDL